MSNSVFRKASVAAIAFAVVAMAAWKAPQASSYLSAASHSAPAVATAAPGVPAVVTNSSYAPVV